MHWSPPIALVAIVAGLAALPSPSRAQGFVSGAQLTKACNGRTSQDVNSCDGYIAGVLDAIRETPELKDKVCPQSGVRLSALREALGKFGQLHPDDAKGPGSMLVANFIKANYPCAAK